jgi:hypothetical protein
MAAARRNTIPGVILSRSPAKMVLYRSRFGFAMTDDWPRLPVEVLSRVIPEERSLIEMEQEDLIRKSQLQVNQINFEMPRFGKGPYGKQYRLLKQDAAKLLRQIESTLAGKVSQELKRAFVRMYDQILSHKLQVMAKFFREHWNDDIKNWEHWSGIGKMGCLIVLSALCVAFVWRLF